MSLRVGSICDMSFLLALNVALKEVAGVLGTVELPLKELYAGIGGGIPNILSLGSPKPGSRLLALEPLDCGKPPMVI